MAKVCALWDCVVQVRQDWTVCPEHYPDFADAKVDICPGCGWLKSKQYEQCLPCRNGKAPPKGRRTNATVNNRIAEPPVRYEVPPTVPATEADGATTAAHVYILKLSSGEFYAGYSEDLESRLMEHRDGRVKSTAGKDPRLVWFDWVSTKAQALAVEDELQHLISRNPRRVRRMVLDFGKLAKLVDPNP